VFCSDPGKIKIRKKGMNKIRNKTEQTEKKLEQVFCSDPAKIKIGKTEQTGVMFRSGKKIEKPEQVFVIRIWEK